ncbi:MAG: homoserine dehydrogenase, partial [Dermatophilaceae bacterium]
MAAGDAPVRLALLGCGVVGSAVARLLTRHAADLQARVGRPLQITGIAVRRAGRDRSATGVSAHVFTTDAAELVTRADVVVEVIGGIEPARSLILRAMAHGASVVTANKALLAEDGPALYAAAAKHGVDLYFEAAVAGAIPLLRPLRESLAGDSVRRVIGIVNGTTNYVLDKMDSTGAGFVDALAQAQALGYAEADPTADVEGFDAAAKAAILASLAFHTRVAGPDVYREGITEVSAADIQAARDMDCVVKLLAICERTDQDDGSPAGVSVRVHPAMIPTRHPLAGVRDAFNAVFVEADAAGPLMFYGRGAGGDP